MPGGDASSRELLDKGNAARAAGDIDAARAAFASAYDLARQTRDVDVMTASALGLANGQTWGALPGRAPAFLHEAYQLATGESRARLAVALARAWVYAGSPDRATPFAAEAVTIAEATGEPTLLADALDAELLVHWGPDDLDDRLRITTRLEDTVAHVADVEARMSAHLWRLTTALECLDMVGVQRQVRALELLADESGAARARFFAASRLGMYALLRGDTAEAATRLDEVRRWGTEANEPDTYALEHTLAAAIARQRHDIDALGREAEVYETFGTTEGAPSVTAQGAVLWLEAGETARAVTLLHQVAGGEFSHLTRDVEWLLTVVSLTEVSVRVGAVDLVEAAIPLLEPYAGRAVVNAGAVAFEGVVDDYLAKAYAAVGRDSDAARATEFSRRAYNRIDAPWWAARLDVGPAAARSSSSVHLRPAGGDTWMVGSGDHAVAVRGMKGFAYLRTLLRNPNVPIRALDLSDAVAGHAGKGVDEPDHGTVIDRAALDTYRRRLAEIDAELDDADAAADTGRAEALALEREALLDEVAAATGLGGRERRKGATSERARVAVRKAIAAAISRVDDVDPRTARLLRDTIRTGTVCVYDADPGRAVEWVLD